VEENIMLKCPKCGSAIKENQKFCTKCGTNLIELIKPKISPEIEAKVDILQKKIAAEPLNASLYIKLGDIYKKNELFTEALSQYQKAVNIDESNIDAHLKSGNVYFEFKELEKAEKSYKSVLNLDPNSSKAQLGLFRIYYTKENFEEAGKLGEVLVKAEPNNIEVHKSLKEIYLKKGMKDQALNEMNQISKLLPDDKSIFLEMAKYHQENGEYKEASEFYKMILKIDSDDIDARFGMGESSCIMGNYQVTIEYIEDIVDKLSPPNKSFARLYLAKAYIDQEKMESAINEIEMVIPPKKEELKTNQREIFAEVYYKAGSALIKDNLSIALDYLEKATKYEPQNLAYKNGLKEATEKQKTDKNNLNRKIIFSVTIAFSILIIAVASWYLSHGKVSINISQGSASVYIDEKEHVKEVQHYLSPNLFFGTHEIKILKDGYEDWEQKVKVGYGKTTIINAELLPIYGGLKISSNPPGAEVYIDDNLLPLGKTPFVTNEILAINHRIELKKEGYKNFTYSIDIARQEVNDLGKITLNNLDGEWKGGAPRAEWEPFEVRINQKECSIEIYFTRKSGSNKINGKLVRPYGSYWGNLRGEVRGQNIFAKGYVTGRYYDAFWTQDKKKQDIAMEGSISTDWSRIEGIIRYGLHKYEFWINRIK